MFQNADYFLPLQDEGDDLHLPAAFRALQGVDFVDLINQPRPGPAAGFQVNSAITSEGPVHAGSD